MYCLCNLHVLDETIRCALDTVQNQFLDHRLNYTPESSWRMLSFTKPRHSSSPKDMNLCINSRNAIHSYVFSLHLESEHYKQN